MLRDIEMNGVRLPDLGVWVFDDQIAIDYRMGPEWRSGQLRTFFQLLMELSRSDPKACVTLDPKTLAEVANRFQACWSRFVSEHVQ
jgi:hypothetical protein